MWTNFSLRGQVWTYTTEETWENKSRRVAWRGHCVITQYEIICVDVCYSNVYYSKVGGVKVHEMNILECRFLELIGWRMYVSPQEYERYMNSVVDATGDDPAGNVEHFLFPDFPDTLDILSSWDQSGYSLLAIPGTFSHLAKKGSVQCFLISHKVTVH